MSKLTATLFSFFLVLGLAGSAGALTIDPNPVAHQRPEGDTGGPLDAEVRLLSLVDDTMTFQLAVNTGAIEAIVVNMLFDSLGSPTDWSYIVDAGVIADSGDEGLTVDLGSLPASVRFEADTPDGKIHAGETPPTTSDEFWVQFDAPIPSGWEGAIGFDVAGSGRDETYAIVAEPVPEPAPGLSEWGVIVLGLLLLTAVGWARVQRHQP